MIAPDNDVQAQMLAMQALVAARPSLWNKALRNRRVMAGTAILVLMLLVAVLAPWLGTLDPALIDVAARNLKPGELLSITLSDGSVVDHTAYFGTDNLGRDIFSRVLYGTRVSLIIGAAVAMISLTIGLLIGLLAGFSGAWTGR